jgi:hypothetical protein
MMYFLELNALLNFTYGMMYLLTEYSTHPFYIFYDFFKTTQMKLWMRLQGKEIRGRSYFSMRK